MSARRSGNPSSGNNAMLLVCDAAGRVQAMTSRAGVEVKAETSAERAGAEVEAETSTEASAQETDFAQFFGVNSAVNRWFLDRIQEARELADYSAEANLDLEGGGTPVFVRLDRLKSENELYRFALQLCSDQPAPSLDKLKEGDSIVTRKQWHEIKNHIGALRLYATFLKRRMPEGDEREIVEKVLQGVNSLIAYLNRIRRGDLQ